MGPSSEEIVRLATLVQCRLIGQVRNLRLSLCADGLIESSGLTVRANEIEVV